MKVLVADVEQSCLSKDLTFIVVFVLVCAFQIQCFGS